MKLMKSKIIPAGLEQADGHGAGTVVNLRPAAGGTLAAISGDTRLAAYGGWTPLLSLSGGRLPRYLMCRGGELAVAGLSSSAGPTPLADRLPSAPTAVFGGSDGSVSLVCATGIYELTHTDGTYGVRPAVRPFPAARLRATGVMDLSVTVGERRLTRNYGTGWSLGGSDLKAVISDFEEAYVKLASEAAGMGRFVQPVLARCAYYDAAGHLLHRTAPTLVCAPGGAQLVDGITLHNSDATTVAAYSIKASVFRISAEVEPDPEGRVARVEVEVSPQFHSWSPTSPTIFTPVRDSTQGIGRLTPGGAVTAASASSVMRAMARIDGVCRSAATLGAPSAAGVAATVANAAGTDIAAEARAFAAALARPVSAATPMECLLSAPHSFGAASMARSGGVCLWGGLHAVRYGGFSPAEYAAADSDGAWRALVVTRFGSGRRAVQASFEGAGSAPATLAPLVCYPAPDATGMSVIIYSGGVTRRADYDLKPTADGRWSAAVSAGLKPVVPQTVSAALIVDIENADADFGDALAVSDAAAPLQLLATVRGGSGAVAAVAAVGGGDSSWEFGRHRFVAGCKSALLSVAVSGADRRRITVRALDSRGMTSPQALCPAAGGVYAAVEDALLLVGNDARRVRRLWSGTFDVLSWDDSQGELTAVNSAGARVFVASKGHGSYRRTGIDGCGVAVAGGQRFFVSPSALILPESNRNARVEAEYSAYGDLAAPLPHRMAAFGARFSGDEASGTLSFVPGNDITAAGSATTVAFGGSPASPLRCAVHCRPCCGASLRFAAAGKHMVFNHFTLEYI